MLLMPHMTIKTLSAATAILLSASSAYCGCGHFKAACDFGESVRQVGNDLADTRKKDIDNISDAGKKAIDDTIKAGEKATQDGINASKKAVNDTVNTGKKAIDDILKTAQKAVDDAIWNTVKGANDIVDAGKASGRFVEHQVRGYKVSLSDAERRIREGKVVDATWHLWTDPYKNDEEGAAKAVQESSLLNTVASTAASYYGGPAGAAAYAAWYTYRATDPNDMDMALRVGVMAGVTSAGYANTAAMPVGTVSEVAKKAIVTGAMGGLAVAAAGGDEAAVREAFLKSGGMVVVQSAQSYVVKEYVDPAVAKADAYCVSTVGTKCSIVLPKLQRDSQGNVILDENFQPKIDNSVTLPERLQIGSWQPRAQPANNQTPGIDQLFTKNNEWAISWDRNAFTTKSSSLPAVVLTYVGPGSPFSEKVEEIKAWAATPVATSALTAFRDRDDERRFAVPPQWVALNNPSNASLYFDRVFPRTADGAITTGAILKSKTNLNIRPSPADPATSPIGLTQGVLVSVIDKATRVDRNGRNQEWVKVQFVVPPQIVAGDGRNDGVDGGSDPTVPLGLRLPMWCFGTKIANVFEIRPDHTIRGLSNQFTLAGRAHRRPDGSISIDAVRSADFGENPFTVLREQISGRIGVRGQLSLTEHGGERSIGNCRSVI